MDDLLKEAIADAKAVRETALANAKMALEEAFTPQLKSMLSKKIQHEIEDDESEDGVEETYEEDDAPDGAEEAPADDQHADEDAAVEEAEVPDDEEAAEEPVSTEGEEVDDAE